MGRKRKGISFLTRRPPRKGVKGGRPKLRKPKNRSSVMKYAKGHFRFIDEGEYYRVIPYRGHYRIYER